MIIILSFGVIKEMIIYIDENYEKVKSIYKYYDSSFGYFMPGRIRRKRKD